jgi:hypothetical protein
MNSGPIASTHTSKVAHSPCHALLLQTGPLSATSISDGTRCIFKLCAAGGYCILVNIYIYIYKHYFQNEAYTYTIIDEMVKPKKRI